MKNTLRLLSGAPLKAASKQMFAHTRVGRAPDGLQLQGQAFAHDQSRWTVRTHG